MLRVVHHVGRQGIEREKVSHFFLLLSVYYLRLADNIGVDDLISWQKVMLHFFVSVMELDHEFAG